MKVRTDAQILEFEKVQSWLDRTEPTITDNDLAKAMKTLSNWIEKRMCGDTFAERVSYAMRRKGYRQSDLADKAGVAENTISQWLSGRSKPTLDYLVALAVALDVSLDWLAMGKR